MLLGPFQAVDGVEQLCQLLGEGDDLRWSLHRQPGCQNPCARLVDGAVERCDESQNS